MSLFLVTLSSVLDQFMAGALLLAFVTVVFLALGGVIVIIYLLAPPVRRGLDGWMDRRRRHGGPATRPFVEDQATLYGLEQPIEPLWDPLDDVQPELPFESEEPEWVTPAPEQQRPEFVR